MASDIERMGVSSGKAGAINVILKTLIGHGVPAAILKSIVIDKLVDTVYEIMDDDFKKKQCSVSFFVLDLFDATGNLARGLSTLVNRSDASCAVLVASAQVVINGIWDTYLTTITSYINASSPPIVPASRLSDLAKLDINPANRILINAHLKLLNGIPCPIEDVARIFSNHLDNCLPDLLVKNFNEPSLIFPGEEREHIAVDTQLVLTFRLKNPANQKEKASTWSMSIPQPKPCEDLNWCTHFDKLERTLGNLIGTVQWKTHRLRTYAYCKDAAEAEAFFEKILKLSTLEALKGNDDKPVRLTSNGSPKRKPRERLIKCTLATWIKFDANAQPLEVYRFRKPGAACP